MSGFVTQKTEALRDIMVKHKNNIMGGALVVGSIIGGYFAYKSRKETQLHKIWDESSQNKVILHALELKPETWKFGTPHASPFVTKLMCYLSINKIPYVMDGKKPGHPKTKKMPWITYKGKHIPDSQLIIEYLNNEHKIDMNAHLSDEQKAVSLAYRTMIEDGLFWVIVYRRVVDKDRNGYDNLVTYFEALVGKSLMLKILAKFMKPKFVKAAYNQGISRYDIDVIYRKGTEMIYSILDKLGNKPYFFGDKISEIDVVIYAFLGGIYSMPFCWKNDAGCLPKPNIVSEYIKRIENQAFGSVKYWKDP